MEVFPEKTYDVTNGRHFIMSLACCACLTEELTMERDEVVFRHRTACGSSSQRRAYADIQKVESVQKWFGLVEKLHSDILPVYQCKDQEIGGIEPGCCCNQKKVGEIIRELNLRRDARGKMAQIKQQQFLLDSLSKMSLQVCMLLKHYNVQYPPDAATVQRIFGREVSFRALRSALHREAERFPQRSWDVTSCSERMEGSSKILTLEEDEAVIERRDVLYENMDACQRLRHCLWFCAMAQGKELLLGSDIKRVPYANVESVEDARICGCCWYLKAGELTNFGSIGQEEDQIMPGCGCSKSLVEEIRDELQKRVEARGAQQRVNGLQEMTWRFEDLTTQLPLLLEKLGAEPHVQECPRSFERNFDRKSYDVWNPGQICCCYVGKRLILAPDELVEETSTCCSKSVQRKAYAHLGPLVFGSCCCCHYLDEALFCQRDLVYEIAEELQERSAGRGDIAQLRNQQRTLIQAMQSDAQVNQLLEKKRLSYPPEQETMHSIYGELPPQLPPIERSAFSEDKLPELRFDIQNCCYKLCNGSQTLTLSKDEAIVISESPCYKCHAVESYAQLGSVQAFKLQCLSFAQTDHVLICPGCGCNDALVNEVVQEMRTRLVLRGRVAQIRQQEELMMEVIRLQVKLDLLLHEAKLSFPPSQDFMDTFGKGSQRPSALLPPPPFKASRRSLVLPVPSTAQPGDELTVQTRKGRVRVTVPQIGSELRVLEGS